MGFVWSVLINGILLLLLHDPITAVNGNKYDCDGQLASSLPPSSFTSSSEFSSTHSAGFARLNRRDGAGGWSPHISNKYQWLQIDLGQRTEITAIATQGKYGSSDWVTSYLLLYSDTGRNWKQYHQEEGIWELTGNTNADSVVHYKLQNHIRARYLRFNPLDWNMNGRIGMRVEIYGCTYSSDIIYLDGKSSIMYRFFEKSISTTKDLISLKFKTMHSDGILLHGEGQNGDRIALELIRGRLCLSIHLGNLQFHASNPHVNVFLGSLLDDQQWHSVVIERVGRQVNFTVDRHVHHFFMKGDISYLDIDYELSFGGITSQGKSASLLQKNFHGCIENLYYNGLNISDLAKRYKPQIHIEGNVSFSCQEPPVVPVTFLNSQSYLVLPGLSLLEEVAISFYFRTWNREGFLFATRLSSAPFQFVVYISDGKLKMSLFKNGKLYLDTVTGLELNNGQWHHLSLAAKRNRVNLIIDNDGSTSLFISLPFQVSSTENYYFGGCSNNSGHHECIQPVSTFLGCMKLISIGENLIDLTQVQQSILGNFSDLQIDLCGIIDRCFPNYCEHGGMCSQTWRDFYCNCSDTGYMGATCHYPKYEQSCEAYKYKGNSSGFFYIDSDGSGPLEPFLVFCNMTDTAISILHHNNTDLKKVKSSNQENAHMMNFKYSADMEQLQATINNSEHCKQEIAYHCKKSRILQKQNVNKCACGAEGNCADSQSYCNCDADKNEWSSDRGFLSNKDHLPVTQIVITDTERPHSEAAYKLGPLLCWGDRSFWNAASFNTISSYLHFPTFDGEFSADVSFFFKTGSPSGLFLENLGIKDFIRIELESPTDVVFSFDVGNGPVEVRVSSPTHLNNSQWHFVKAERNIKEASLQVDTLPQKTYTTPSDGHIRLQLYSQLFIGGTPSRQKGFLGCIRSLKLNGIPIDLEERAKVTPGIKPGCPGHCSSYGNLCNNGGRCVEKHNGFLCDCSLSAYTGAFCKKEISAQFDAESSLTYHNEENFTMMKNSSLQISSIYADSYSKENIAFHFRTTQAPCLLLFAQSLSKAYISVIISRNGSLQIRYKLNYYHDPDVFTINSKNLADGQLHRVSIMRNQDILFVEVNQYASEQFILSSGTKFNTIHSLALGKISVAHDIDVDPETMKASANGFIGCLSAVRFNNIVPLKAAFKNSLASQIVIKGHVSESSCGSINGEDAGTGETTHSFADHSGTLDNGEQLTNALKSGFALIGGVISVAVFILLCIAGIAIRIYLQKNEYKKNEAKESEHGNNVEAAAALKAELSMQNTFNESQKEYFF
ncbi:contactin-associated protein-like 4 isoform X3 [Hyla sarda]|uniref:contactin-associated protein-like 4 isoform X3 n=1 Tax=Hyla sarda TaxID=327740 RepID=UPI0024C260CA|nr:contactin-associated protein-like 4 isoform X3 [Hyla sarda]